MKQARRWLLLAAALVLLPQAAYAQKKKPKAGSAGTPPAAAPAGDTQTAPADMDADQPTPAPGAPATPPAGGDQTGTPPAGGDTGAAGGGGMDICQITPDAPQCAASNEINLGVEAKKAVRAEVYAVQQQYVIKAQRFEIQPYFAVTLNDQFVTHDAPGLALNYYITQVLAVGVNGAWYGALNNDSDFNFQNRRAARIAVPLNDYQMAADLNFTYVPMYGKFAGFGDFIFHYDAYIDGGVGIIRTEPIPVIDPDNRSFTWNTLVNFDVGIGLRIFFNRWLAAVLEVRDIMYFEKIENIHTANGAAVTAGQPGYANSPLNPATWYDPNTHFTNDVQLQVGLSLFLPTSFDYTLPK
ncbi:MAG TPA: outer membrane beta-barrel domain-containing protein [Polyangiaceae bacterium]|nr:outer membrane beta-barrel domain-containing protein [Polyangiaceae bacterium]